MTQSFSLWRLFGIEKHHQLLLKWMVLIAVAVFAFFLVSKYGLVQEVFRIDRTYISLTITLLFAATSVHCMLRIVFVSHQLNLAGRAARMIAEAPRGIGLDGPRVRLASGEVLPPGALVEHVRDLVLKARSKPGRLDQTLLLKAFEEKRKPNFPGR